MRILFRQRGEIAPFELIEIEDADGKSINVGEWSKQDGYDVLTIPGPFNSVLQDWVMTLPLRQQGVLVISLRGPDGVRKEDPAKPLVRTLRGLIMNAGRTGVPMKPGVVWRDDPFMSIATIGDDQTWSQVARDFFDQWDAYNVHFLQHLAHAYAVIGMNYPHDDDMKNRAWWFYDRCCRKLHMTPETPQEIAWRLRSGVREEDGKE